MHSTALDWFNSGELRIQNLNQRHWCLHIDKKETEEKVLESAGALRPLWPQGMPFVCGAQGLTEGLCGLPGIPALVSGNIIVQLFWMSTGNLKFRHQKPTWR